MKHVLLVGLILCAACSRAAPPAPPSRTVVTLPAGALVDLSHTYDSSTIFWPTAEGFARQKVAHGETPAGYYYAAPHEWSQSSR